MGGAGWVGVGAFQAREQLVQRPRDVQEETPMASVWLQYNEGEAE